MKDVVTDAGRWSRREDSDGRPGSERLVRRAEVRFGQ